MHSSTDEWIYEHRAQLLEAVRESVGIPSVKGEAEPGAPFGAQVKRALTHVLGVAGKLGLAATDMDGYIGYADGGEGDELLALLSHVDVVGVGDGWTYPPFDATVTDGRMYGRGVIDDKGPALGSLFALAAVRACGYRFKRRVRLIFGCDEESGWGCIYHYLAQNGMPDLAFSPDSEYPLVNSEKGIAQLHYGGRFPSNIIVDAGIRANIVPDTAVATLPLDVETVRAAASDYMGGNGFSCEVKPLGDGRAELTIKGLAAHAAVPQEGKNALIAMLDVLSKLPLSAEDARMAKGLYGLFENAGNGESCALACEDASGRLTLNVAVLRWDAAGISELALDSRYPASKPGDYVSGVMTPRLGALGLKLESADVKPGHYIEPKSELVSTLMGIFERRTGLALPPLAIGGGTYARCLDQAVGFGCMRPGVKYNAHMNDEVLYLDQYMEDVCMMADAIVALACE